MIPKLPFPRTMGTAQKPRDTHCSFFEHIRPLSQNNTELIFLNSAILTKKLRKPLDKSPDLC